MDWVGSVMKMGGNPIAASSLPMADGEGGGILFCPVAFTVALSLVGGSTTDGVSVEGEALGLPVPWSSSSVLEANSLLAFVSWLSAVLFTSLASLVSSTLPLNSSLFAGSGSVLVAAVAEVVGGAGFIRARLSVCQFYQNALP